MNSDHNSRNRIRAAERLASPLRRIEQIPRSLVVLYFVITAITSMFAGLVVAYIYTHTVNDVVSSVHPFPRYFSLSTIVLLGSSYVLSQARWLYEDDDLTMLARCLAATLLLGCVFAGLQVLGWHELLGQGVRFGGGNGHGTYLYIISGLHVAHVLAGMVYILVVLLRVIHADQDAVRSLVFIRNPYYRRQLTMLSTYWHFVDGLWLLLFAVFIMLY
jgi:cytochrome c oxidase subunit 3